jgi:hypothetical protein
MPWTAAAVLFPRHPSHGNVPVVRLIRIHAESSADPYLWRWFIQSRQHAATWALVLGSVPGDTPEPMAADITPQGIEEDQPSEPVNGPAAPRPIEPFAPTFRTLPRPLGSRPFEGPSLRQRIGPDNPHGRHSDISEGSPSGHPPLMPSMGTRIEPGHECREGPHFDRAACIPLQGPPEERGEHGIRADEGQLPDQHIREGDAKEWEGRNGRQDEYKAHPESHCQPSKHEILQRACVHA